MLLRLRWLSAIWSRFRRLRSRCASIAASSSPVAKTVEISRFPLCLWHRCARKVLAAVVYHRATVVLSSAPRMMPAKASTTLLTTGIVKRNRAFFAMAATF